MAQRTQNIQYDDEGKVLFFEVDGNVYNRDGFLIVDTRQGDDDADCFQCFAGGWQVHFIPVPGSCRLFFIVGVHHDGFERDLMAGSQLKVDWGILDIGLVNENPLYQGLCAPVTGAMLPMAEVYGDLLMQASAGAAFTVNNASGITVFETVRVGPSDIFSHEFVYSAAIRVDAAGRHLMAIAGNSKVHLLEFNAQGFRAIPQHWSLPVASRRTQRGEVAMHFDGSELKVAYSCYRPTYANMPCPTHVTEAVLYRFQVNLSAPIQVTLAPTAPGQYNPWPYALDMYCRTDPAPVDHAGNDIDYPATAGLEFSPNGDYLYFVKSPSFPHPSPYVAQPEGPPTTFGGIDLNWAVGDPGSPRIYLPIGTEVETRALCDTQLDINVAPDGIRQALYMIGADAQGEYWLGCFKDPDYPDPASAHLSWTRHLVDFGQVGMLIEDDSPATEHRLLNRRAYNSIHQTLLQHEICCEDLTLAKDRSTTINPDCDLTWEPGSNAFWDTDGPIHVATELRIATGAHVVAQDMTFKFGEKAMLVVDRGASFKCTNCLFTNACPDKRWRGIAVSGIQGDPQAGDPHPTYVGHLVLRASIVEHATAGIATSGGVIDVAAATLLVDDDGDEETPPIEVWTRSEIRNCHRGVMFRNYQNFLPASGTLVHNRSRFEDVRFSVDTAYMADYGFKEHASLWKVSGIPFIACTFENTLPDDFFAATPPGPNAPYHGSQFLGHGIRSLDANFRVAGKCTQPWPAGGPPCPDSLFRRSAFTGLDHGIHALQGSKLRNFSVDRAQFNDNIAGVYAEGVVGYVVKNSEFSIGNRNVAMTNFPDESYWGGHHRGIYSKRCYGFTVDDNTLCKTPGSPDDRRTEGIVIGYSGDHNDYVFRNHGRNLSQGFVGEGNCASTEDSFAPILGLQLLIRH